MRIKRILIFISKLLSFSPVCTISDDRFFGEIDKSNFDKNEIRYSLISAKFGVKSIYFITKKKGENLKIFCCQNLYRTQGYPNVTKVDAAYGVYETSLQSLNEKKKQIHKETLLYRIAEVEKTINKTFNKFLAYLALIVFIIPLFSDYFKEVFKYREVYQATFISILTYQFFNLMFLSYSFIKVRSVGRIRFRAVRDSVKPLNAFILMLYYDWLSYSQESTMQVSIMRNIEKYIVTVVISSSLFLITHNIVSYVEEEVMAKAGSENVQENKVRTINNLCLNRFNTIVQHDSWKKEPRLLMPLFCYKDFNDSVFIKGE